MDSNSSRIRWKWVGQAGSTASGAVKVTTSSCCQWRYMTSSQRRSISIAPCERAPFPPGAWSKKGPVFVPSTPDGSGTKIEGQNRVCPHLVARTISPV